MNKYLKYIICCLLPLTAVSCFQEDIVEPVGNDDIVLTFDGAAMTKAADTEAEAYVDHVDVLIFDASENKVHHERVVNKGADSFTLAAKRSSFSAGTGYYVYLIANSSAEVSAFNSLVDMDALKTMTQEDPGIMYANSGGDSGHNFLMDAVAYTGTTEPQTPGTVVLNDGVMSNSTYLNATFRRAAAKVVVTINQGTDILFATDVQTQKAAYYMRNTPVSTTVIDGYPINPTLKTPSPAPQNTNFVWDENVITLTAYAYEYNWEDQSIQDKETSLVVNIPVTTVGGGFSENNWYKIPVSQSNSFERNHIYTVTVTVNALGAISPDDPQELDDLIYNVEEWKQVGVTVGDNSNKPAYLQLNTNHVDMYNVNEDNSTLEFASSSEISADGITLLEAYYIDYLDQRVNLENHPKYNVYSQIKATADAGVLNGGITIVSPFVGRTNEEIQNAIAELGEAPTVDMEEPQLPVSPEKTAPDPEEIVERYNQGLSSNSRSRIAYRGEGANVEFYAVANNPNTTARRNVQIAQEEYSAAWAEYSEWENMTQEDKDAALGEYNTALNTYQSQKQLYDAQVAALQEYNMKVQAIYNSSENSHSNAIRYLKFRVTNSTGQTAEFTVNQYPTIYITNDRGHYSYRSDFGGTTYLQAGNPNYSGANWNDRSWSYGEESSGSYFFGSKVALGSEGNYTINYTYWDSFYSSISRETENISTLNNPRMYHVHVTSTSANYIVSKPRLDENNYTESSAENTKLVSPSFMIASQLGATLTPNGGIEQARSHCERYVEVTAVDYDGDGQPEVYDDWRLPTAAEIDIIIQHQDVSDAMAVVLTGSAYYCAYNTNGSGGVIYTKSTGKSGTQTAVRCVRDAY